MKRTSLNLWRVITSRISQAAAHVAKGMGEGVQQCSRRVTLMCVRQTQLFRRAVGDHIQKDLMCAALVDNLMDYEQRRRRITPLVSGKALL